MKKCVKIIKTNSKEIILQEISENFQRKSDYQIVIFCVETQGVTTEAASDWDESRDEVVGNEDFDRDWDESRDEVVDLSHDRDVDADSGMRREVSKKYTEEFFKSGIRPMVYLEKSFPWLRTSRIRRQKSQG